MIEIKLSELDPNLVADIADSPDVTDWTAHSASYEGETCAGQEYHIVHSVSIARGGIVFVGSGSSGVSDWTDADTPEEVLQRFTSDEMRR